MNEVCAACNQPILRSQKLYKIKLDNGNVVFSHGYPCCGKFEINRPKPILPPDWWINEVMEWEREAKP